MEQMTIKPNSDLLTWSVSCEIHVLAYHLVLTSQQADSAGGSSTHGGQSSVKSTCSLIISQQVALTAADATHKGND
jgi:hypothetical protein